MKYDCYDCTYFKEEVLTDSDCCIKNNSIVDTNKICENFKLPQNCLDCIYSSKRIYETGTIDEIDYHCKLQDEKLIYEDISPMNCHNADIPNCPINKYKREK